MHHYHRSVGWDWSVSRWHLKRNIPIGLFKIFEWIKYAVEKVVHGVRGGGSSSVWDPPIKNISISKMAESIQDKMGMPMVPDLPLTLESLARTIIITNSQGGHLPGSGYLFSLITGTSKHRKLDSSSKTINGLIFIMNCPVWPMIVNKIGEKCKPLWIVCVGSIP